MTDLYIATPTQRDHNALIHLAEVAGYRWWTGSKATKHDYDWTNYYDNKGGEVIYLDTKKRELTRASRHHYEREGATIETIPNLADIKGIWHVSKEYARSFQHKYMSTPIYSEIMLVMNSNNIRLASDRDIYKALAVDYKPEEGWVMPEKVKLPKFMCDWLDETRLQSHADYPFNIISDAINTLGRFDDWLWKIPDNQWKLIDALRNGYEAEPEQLYYVWFVKGDLDAFLNVRKSNNGLVTTDKNETLGYKTRFTMPEILAIDPRYKAFAVPVEEVDE